MNRCATYAATSATEVHSWSDVQQTMISMATFVISKKQDLDVGAIDFLMDIVDRAKVAHV